MRRPASSTRFAGEHVVAPRREVGAWLRRAGGDDGTVAFGGVFDRKHRVGAGGEHAAGWDAHRLASP